jgi:hypothetical protein
VALPEQRAVVGRAQDRDGKALRHPERQRSSMISTARGCAGADRSTRSLPVGSGTSAAIVCPRADPVKSALSSRKTSGQFGFGFTAQHHRAAVAAQHEKELVDALSAQARRDQPWRDDPGAIGGVGGHPSGIKAEASMRRL